MDAVADATDTPDNRPEHFVSDESQQRKFCCKACDEFNDIIGRYGFCARCGTRSDLAEFEEVDMPRLRGRLVAGDSPDTCLREAVAAFDSFAAQYARQLAQHVRMTPRRKDRLTKKRFQDIEEMRAMFDQWFDINVADGLKQDDLRFITLKVHRRHLYEHTGGEVDDKYLRDSGDDTVRLKERIRESPEDVHRLLGIILRMARNLHEGFHEVLPPRDGPIEDLPRERPVSPNTNSAGSYRSMGSALGSGFESPTTAFG